MDEVTQLSGVGQAGATAVSLVGEVRVAEPLLDPHTGTTYAVMRTDVGFTIERYKQVSSTKEFVFKVAERQIQAGPGLHLTTEGGRVELDPQQLKIEQETTYTTPCDGPPAGFERVTSSQYASQGPMGRRDHRLLPGDRVELLGSVERTANGYQTVGEYELRDLSAGRLTKAEEEARDRRIAIILLVSLAVVVGGVALAIRLFGA